MWTPFVPVSPQAGREGRNWGSSLLSLPDLEQVVWKLQSSLGYPDFHRPRQELLHAEASQLGLYPCPNFPICRIE